MLPGLRPKVLTDLHRERAAIPWVDDEELRKVDRRSPGAAFILGVFTWGGGLMYAQDRLRGGLGIAALFGWFVIGPRIPPQVLTLGWVGLGALLGAIAYRRVRALNRFASTRDELARGTPAGAALVDPMLAGARSLPSPVDASRPADSLAPSDPRIADAVKRLRKLAALGTSGVLKPHELQDRKLDVLGRLAPDSKAALDDLLYALLPLLDEGTLTQDDLELVKSLATGT